MSTERDELADLPASQLAFMAALKNGAAFEGDGRAFRAGFDAALVWTLPPKPRTVTTAAELDALPVGSVVLDEYSEAHQKSEDNFDRTHWYLAGQDLPMRPSLPATVLHEGTG